ncbi:hypothetical protein ACGFXC_28740 [Streptomyces sp. NPDC048507]|uniref:hypothetical protein n=1 Tax=Streptomyces sp. NPDC048507 TaxID=3365560 RepID=UPI003718026F
MATSLVLGPAAFLTAGSAEAAVPTTTCTVTKSLTEGQFDVSGKGLTPGAKVIIRGGGNQISKTADANGSVSVKSVFPNNSKVTLIVGKKSNPKETVSCGTAQQAQQKDAQDQLKKGFAAGFAATRTACTEKAPPQGVAPLDPNFEKGFKQGVDAAINSKFCQDKIQNDQ